MLLVLLFVTISVLERFEYRQFCSALLLIFCVDAVEVLKQCIHFVTKATGGGAYKYADLFKERLGVSIDKEDEMDCLVAGANFLLKVVPVLNCLFCLHFI